MLLAADMIAKKVETDKVYGKASKRIMIVTNAANPPAEDMAPLLGDAAAQIADRNIKLTFLGVGFTDVPDDWMKPEEWDSMAEVGHPWGYPLEHDPSKDAVQAENENMIRAFAAAAGDGVVITGDEGLSMLSALRSKAVLTRTNFRSDLMLGGEEGLAIPLFSYVKTTRAKRETLKRLSKRAPPNAEFADRAVALNRNYYLLEDPDKLVDEDNRVKGYRYGKTMVPFGNADEATLKYTANKELSIIGFADAASVPRRIWMSQSCMLFPAPADDAAATALSALVRALAETDRVIIARHVFRANATPKLVALFPHIKSDYEALVMQILPFREDVREFEFPSWTLHKEFQPDENQLSAAENLIDAMDLMKGGPDGDTELSRPKQVFNPSLQHLYASVVHRAREGPGPLPPLDADLAAAMEPDPFIMERAKDSIAAFKDAFGGLTAEEGGGAASTGTRRAWAGDDEDLDIDLNAEYGDAGPATKKQRTDTAGAASGVTLDNLVAITVTSVGSTDPVGDFQKMLADQSQDRVTTAIKEMQEVVRTMVSDAVTDAFLAKAEECLAALRTGCLQQDEPEAWNTFLRDCKSRWIGAKPAMWGRVVGKGLSLIHSGESEDTDVTPEEAVAFLAAEEAAPTDAAAPAADPGDDEDIFDMIE